MNDIIFRRINGHIVPIKHSASSSHKKEVVEVKPQPVANKRAAFNVASGFSLAALGGAVAGVLDRRHATLHNVARNARSDLFKRKFAARTRLEGIRAGAAASVIKKGSAVAGAALIGAGVRQTLDKTDLSDTQKNAIATGSGLGAFFAVRTAHTKLLGNTSFKWAAKHAISRILVRGGKL